MSNEYEDFRESVRKLAKEQVAPYASTVDHDERFPTEAWSAMCAADLPGLAHPEHLGGGGGDLRSQVIAVEEIAAACSSSAMVLLVNWAGTCTVISAGSDELQRLVVPGVSSGEVGAGWCLTEPSSGSDLAGLTTIAVREGDGWVLNGHKRFISNAGWGDWFAVLAKTGPGSEFGVFLVHRSDDGVSFGPQEKKMGLRGSPTADVHLDHCWIPAVRVVGDPTLGYRYIMNELNGSRALIAAQALGIARGALAAAVEYTANRVQFGEPISRFQMVRSMVADMAIRIESAAALLSQAVDLIEAGDRQARARVSMAKVLCSDNAMAVTTDAVQLFGGYGYMRDYPVERMMRDAKVTQIYEGSNQIQRLVISKAIYESAARQ